jgi:transcriptional regulator GlxA family with amidase domain
MTEKEKSAAPRKIKVGMVLFPRFQLLDIAGPADAFGEVSVLSQGQCEYELMTIGATRGAVTSSSGVAVTPDRVIFDPCPVFDTIIIPGGLGVFDASEDTTLTDWLVRQASLSRRIGSICNGVFALGNAGLIDHKTVTTHWMDAANLAQKFPRATVEPDRIYVKDGRLYSTAGVTAGIDLALTLIEEDFGRKMAVDVAKYLIVYLRRAGGQSQFSPLLATQAGASSQIEELQGFVLKNLRAPHTLESMAQHLHMSPRNLSRVFRKECGVTPMDFLADARIDAARRYLENTDMAMKEVATECGFDTADSLRRVFNQRLQITPVEYRQRFHSSTDAPA